MNYGVVGTGYWGSNHVRVGAELRDAGRLDEVTICDVDEERAAELAAEHDVGYTTDHETLDVDAAVVATPSTTHEDIATDLLAADTDLLVEKPLALSSAAAWNLVETADRHDRTLGVGHIFRYHPGLRELKRRIDAGELGRIKYLFTTRFAFRVPRDTTGVLYSLAVHDVDVYNFLLGEWPDSVACRLDSFVRDGIDETASLTLGYGDRTGVIHSSWQVPVFGKRRQLVAVGTERSAALDYLADNVVEIYDASVEPDEDGTLQAREGRTIIHETAAREPLKAEVEAFLDAAREGRDPPASGLIGAQTVETLEAAQRAAATGRVVEPGVSTVTEQPMSER
jgi:predicted dehydrogenase